MRAITSRRDKVSKRVVRFSEGGNADVVLSEVVNIDTAASTVECETARTVRGAPVDLS
jgi:hypothetical protein